ncbi:MAG: TIGR03560 family F420-dependent LLM class oxidoreductase [Candidatus Ranarchaeia archaeon]
MDVKFGIQIEPQFGFSYEMIEKIALAAENVGYDSIWCSDHFFLDDKSETRDCLEAWTVLAGLAVRTKKIRLGPLVSCNSYRHPAVLAKIAASVDVMSQGRLLFGIGAGWKEIEYNAYGMPFPTPRERLDRLEEAVQLIKLLWTTPKVAFPGEYYTLKDAFSAPKPVQKPTPPIFIGGGGVKRLLKIVAKYADYSNLVYRKGIEEKLDALKRHCKTVNRDYKSLGKSLFAGFPGIFVSDSEQAVEEHLQQLATKRQISVNTMKDKLKDGAPGSWIGYPEQLQERFQHFIAMGFDYFQLIFPGHEQDTLDASQRFAKLVMHKL